MKARYFLFLSMASIFMLGACSSDDALDNEQPWGEYNGNWDEEAAEYEKAFDRPADTYTYPIEIGSDEYIELNKQGMQAVHQAFEIPTATLKGMSTAGIIQSFIEYPFLMDFDVAHPSIQYSVECLKSMNLGQELITRKDAGEWLLRYWMTYPSADIKAGKAPRYMRYLISVPEITQTMTTNQIKNFMYRALSNWPELEDSNGKLMSNTGYIYMFGKLLQSAGYKPLNELLKKDKELDDFLNVHELGCPVPKNIEEVFLLTNKFMTNK